MATIKDSEIGIFSLNEKRNRQIDDALIRNKEKAKKIGVVAIPNFGSIIKNQVDRAKVDNSDMFDGLEIITNDETRKNFEQSFSNTEALFARINLTSPTPEEFEKAGVDFNYLANEYERMYKEHLVPSLIIAPTLRLAPTKNDSVNVKNQCWKGLYDNLIIDKTIIASPLKENPDGASIWMSNDVLQDNEYLFENELDLVTSGNIHYITNEANDKTQSVDAEANTITWTIALIQGTDSPQDINNPYSGFKEADDPINSKNVTISQYLTYQARSIQSGDNVLDSTSFTWLYSSYADSSKALHGEWHPSECRVRLDWRFNVIGVRPTIWG